jgi:hypothetical protein
MNRRQSDCDFSADPGRNVRESAARLMEQSEIAELFDNAARRRFGQWISASRLALTKPRRGPRAAGAAADERIAKAAGKIEGGS